MAAPEGSLLDLLSRGAGACRHRRIQPLPALPDGSVDGRCADCGEDGFPIREAGNYDDDPLADAVVVRAQLEAVLADLERAMEHWPRLKPLYGEEQTEATSALSEIGCCVGDALHRVRQLLAE